MLGELLSGSGHWFPVGWAGVVAEGEPSVHDKCAVGDGTVHSDEVRIVL